MTAILRLFALMPFLVHPASALAVYKCEVQGKVLYGDGPCADGKVTVIDTTSSRVSETLANEGAQRSRREREILKHLQSSRQKDEAAENKARQKRVRAQEALQKKCRSLAMKLTWSEEDAAEASGKSAEKARRSAQRHREKYRAECGSK